MMTCEKYKNIILTYVDGTITDEQLAEINTHTETCES